MPSGRTSTFLNSLKLWSLPPRVVRVLGDPRFRLEGPLLALGVTWDGDAWTVEEPGVLRHWTTTTGREHTRHVLSEFELLWAFSPDGRRLVSGGDDWSLWDTATGEVLLARPQPSWVTALTFRADGALLATGHDDGRVRLWDAAAGRLLREWTGPTASVSSLAFSPDGLTLAVGAEDKAIRLWNVPHGLAQGRLTGHTDRITGLAWHPQGRVLASSGWDTTARLWDTVSGEPLFLLNGQAQQVNTVAYAPDGSLMATADSDHVVWLWEPLVGQVRQRLRGHTGDVTCLAFAADSRHLVSGGGDGRLILWDTQTGENVLRTSESAVLPPRVSLRPDGAQQVAALFGGRGAHLWDDATGEPRGELAHLPAPATAVKYSPDGQWLATGHAEGRVQLWDAGRLIPGPMLVEHKTRITALDFDRENRFLASAGGVDGYVFLWSLAEYAPVLLIPEAAEGCSVEAVGFVPGAPLLIAGGVDWTSASGQDGCLVLWDIGRPGPVAVANQGALALAVRSDGKQLAAAMPTESVCLYDARTLELKRELVGHAGLVTGLAYHAAGRFLVTAGEDGTVRFWETASGRQVNMIETDVAIRDLALSPDGRHLYTANANATSYLIDLSRTLLNRG